MAAIIENESIGRVNALQFQDFLHGRAEGRKLGFIEQRHDQQGWACIEMVAILADLIAATPDMIIFFDHRHTHALPGEVGCGGYPSNTRSNNDDMLRFHLLPILSAWKTHFKGSSMGGK